MLRAIGTDLVTTGAQTAFALVAISVTTVDWRGLWAVAVVAAYVAHAQRSHIRLQQRHGALQRLNEVAARLNQDLHADVIAQEIVAGAVRTFDASAAELVLSGETQRFRHDTAPSP